jgi:beta-mannosidase
MFVEQQKHGAKNTSTIEREIVHIVRKLAAHPSIVVWNGCNECFPKQLEPYEFALQTVAEVDDTRPIWPTSPSSFGWDEGVYTLNSLPNGKPLKARTQGERGNNLETHGPYNHGYSRDFPGA